MSTSEVVDGRPGERLRNWRERHGISQLDLAIRASTSQRHVSFLEQGRSRPGRTMLLRLAESMAMPLRDRNELLMSAGFLPAYSGEPLDSNRLAPIRGAIRHLLTGFDPYPSILVDISGDILDRNRSADLLFEGADPELLAEPANAYRLALHPAGLSRNITNFDTWAHHVVQNLRDTAARTARPALAKLVDELEHYVPTTPPTHDHVGFAVPVEMTTPDGPLRLTTTLMTFPTSVDVNIDELRLEAFLPADAATADRLRARFAS